MNGLISPILHAGNVSFAFSESALPGKLIVLILFASSIGAWYVKAKGKLGVIPWPISLFR